MAQCQWHLLADYARGLCRATDPLRSVLGSWLTASSLTMYLVTLYARFLNIVSATLRVVD
jgi:hypothetical protein